MVLRIACRVDIFRAEPKLYRVFPARIYISQPLNAIIEQSLVCEYTFYVIQRCVLTTPVREKEKREEKWKGQNRRRKKPTDTFRPGRSKQAGPSSHQSSLANPKKQAEHVARHVTKPLQSTAQSRVVQKIP